MLRVGITGGIGSGKTTVCRLFELLGVPVYYADIRAKELMNTDEVLKERIEQEFGDEAYSGTGLLNRKYLASVVFNNEQRLQALNGLVHPAVFRDFDRWAAQQGTAYVLKEAAILFESGSDKDCDFTILVKSPEELRLQRVMRRDGLDAAEVKKRMDKQLSDDQKEQLADFVLLNNERELLIPQVLRLHRELTERGTDET